MIPGSSQLELPLLQALVNAGGEAEFQALVPEVRSALTAMTDEEAAMTVPSGEFRWIHHLRRARFHLARQGDLESRPSGVWAITDQGRHRLSGPTGQAESHRVHPLGARAQSASLPPPAPSDLEELYETYEAAFRDRLLQQLFDLTPAQFEVFAHKLLKAYGFSEVQVTGRPGDGGVDGYGRLRVGLAYMDVAFQCKRWTGNVPRTEIDRFRGAVSGQFEQGIFFTTSDFTRGATQVSIRKGAVPIVLVNGPMIVELMLRTGFGVIRRPMELLYENLSTLLKTDS